MLNSFSVRCPVQTVRQPPSSLSLVRRAVLGVPYSLCHQKLRLDALAIVPIPRSKLPPIIAKLHFNLPRLGMSLWHLPGYHR